MNEETVANNDNTVTIESLGEKIDTGFYQNGERLDSLENRINDHFAGENEQLNTMMEVVAANNEKNDNEEQEVDATIEETLVSISDQIVLQNQIISGQNFMLGIITGILLFKILWERLRA